MDKVLTDSKAKAKRQPRLTQNSKLFKCIINAIKEKKGESIVSLDLRHIDEAVADFFIVCEAQSHVQLQAIGNNIHEKVKEECLERPYHSEYGHHWVLIDYVNVVVHIFDREQRKFYDIEGLWADAKRTEHD